MNIAICDDNPAMSGKLKSIVDECFLSKSASYSLTIFMSGEELLRHLEKWEMYHIYILDIELNAVSGLEVAKKIRQNDYNAIIIFVTSHKELMQEAFEVLAFNYIVKPFDELNTKRIILKAIDHVNIKKRFFTYKLGKRNYTENLDRILYFESKGRKVNINTIDQVIECYGTMKSVLEQVELQMFVQIHKSYIINMEYLKTIEGEYVILKDEQKLPISKKFISTLNSAYRNYIIMRS